jgi:hypothetical protein
MLLAGKEEISPLLQSKEERIAVPSRGVTSLGMEDPALCKNEKLEQLPALI